VGSFKGLHVNMASSPSFTVTFWGSSKSRGHVSSIEKTIYKKLLDIKPIKLQWNLSKPNPAYTEILDKLNCK
jgi:hypothetical protein